MRIPREIPWSIRTRRGWCSLARKLAEMIGCLSRKGEERRESECTRAMSAKAPPPVISITMKIATSLGSHTVPIYFLRQPRFVSIRAFDTPRHITPHHTTVEQCRHILIFCLPTSSLPSLYRFRASTRPKVKRAHMHEPRARGKANDLLVLRTVSLLR